MIEEKVAAFQVARLSGLSFFPNQDPAVQELVAALQVADSEGIAKATVDDLLHDAIECPKPSEIRRIANLKNEKSAPAEPYWMQDPTPSHYCHLCKGWGTCGTPPNADFCSCSNGRTVRNDPRLGDKWLAIVNSGRASGNIAALARAVDSANRTGRTLERL